jgi:pimeloyl-ACP methyl ester carboxylesterase
MSKLPMARLVAILAVLGVFLLGGCVGHPRAQEPKAQVDFLEIDSGMKLRRMVVHNERPKGVVLLLHGFPETLHAWNEIAPALARDYEVHAFDWPGFGLSSRPPVDKFSYAPRDYARVLKDYIEKAGIDKSKLVIYATDIGALPALLLALEDPGLAQNMIVGDFAPFNRPRYMQENLQNLKSKATSDPVRAALNKNRDEILENAFRRGLRKDEQFALAQDFKDDMLRGWSHGDLTSADAFYHYYSHFTRDQEYLELHVARLTTPVKVVWGEKDFYIDKEMGVEFARHAGVDIDVLPGLGHYPHLQSPGRTVEEIRASFGRQASSRP